MTTQNDNSRKAYRQGELLFVPLSDEDMAKVDPQPRDGAYPCWKKLQTNIIREGEATGHKHEVMEEEAGTATILAPARQFMEGLLHMSPIGAEDRMLVAQQPVEVVHPEHRPLALPRGNFLVIVQREYDEVKARRILD